MPFRPPKKQPQFADLVGILAQSKTQDNPMYQTIEVIIDRLVQFHGNTVEQLAITANKLNEVIKEVNKDIGDLDDFVESINVVQPNRVLGRGFSSGPGPQEELIPGVYISIFEQIVPVTGEILKIIDVTGAGDTPFIVQNLDEVRSRLPEGKLPGDYLPRAQETKLLASGYVTVTTGTGVLGSTATIPSGDVELPTASLGQVLISQGAGVQPVFSPNPFVNSLNASYVDLAIATGIDPAINTARLHSLDVNGFSMVEVRDGGSNVVRLASDNVVVAKVVEPAGVSRGQVLYISGAAGANPLVRLAQSNNINTMPGIGVALDPGVNNEFIRILVSGTIQLINTSAFAEGASLFVSTTVAGGFTTVLPDAPNFGQRIGFVTRSHATQGEILVLTTGVAAPPRLHAPTHSLGGTDPVSVTALAGYPGGTVNFLRADGTFSPPPSGGSPGPHASTHAVGQSDPVIITTLAGYPGGTVNFLRADGTFSPPPTGGIPSAHHATHEPGGSDALVNAAWTNLANVFTQNQTITTSSFPSVLLTESSQPINGRVWRMASGSGSLRFTALDDALTTGLSLPLMLERSGRAIFGSRISQNHADPGLYQNHSSSPGLWRLTAAGNYYIQALSDLEAEVARPLELLRNGNVLVGSVLTAPGGLGTTPLNATNLTSGTVPDARLSSNVALKNIDNIFTAQTLGTGSVIQGANAVLGFNALNSAVDTRRWRIVQFGDVSGNLFFQSLNDASTVAQGTINFDRAGVGTFAGLGGTPLNATNLTSGTVPAARLDPNIAYKNINNVFTAQTIGSGTVIEGTDARFHLRGLNSPVNSRLWRFSQLGDTNGYLQIEALTDVGGVQSVVTFDRVGAANFPGGLAQTPLNATQLTIGTVPDARLSANVALKNIDNNFIAQTMGSNTRISGSGSVFYLADTIAGVDLKVWRFNNIHDGHIRLEAVNDANTIVQTSHTFRRDGWLNNRGLITSGIKFDPAIADVDPKTLDVYNEENWVPGLNIVGGIGTIAYSTRIGTTVKAGQLLVVQCNVILSALTGAGTGTVTIEGMPYNSGTVPAAGTCLWQSLNVAIDSMAVYMIPGTNVLYPHYSSPATGGNMSVVTGNMLTANSAFYISIPLRSAS